MSRSSWPMARPLAPDEVPAQRTAPDLPGLPDRAGFLCSCRMALAEIAPGRCVAVIVVRTDLGDAPAGQIAAAVRRAVRGTDTVALTGAFQVGVLCRNLRDAAAASRISDRLLQVLAEPAVGDGSRDPATASLGVATASGGESADAALARAESTGHERSAPGGWPAATPPMLPIDRLALAPAHADPPWAPEIDFADLVVRRLHGVGLLLASCSARTPDDVAVRLKQAVGEIDAVIHDSRTFILDRVRRSRGRETEA